MESGEVKVFLAVKVLGGSGAGLCALQAGRQAALRSVLMVGGVWRTARVICCAETSREDIHM